MYTDRLPATYRHRGRSGIPPPLTHRVGRLYPSLDLPGSSLQWAGLPESHVQLRPIGARRGVEPAPSGCGLSGLVGSEVASGCPAWQVQRSHRAVGLAVAEDESGCPAWRGQRTHRIGQGSHAAPGPAGSRRFPERPVATPEVPAAAAGGAAQDGAGARAGHPGGHRLRPGQE